MLEKICIFSPHCDDVALSLGGAIYNKRLGRNILVEDIFTVSNYTIIKQGISDVDIVTKIRNDEEKKAMNMLGVDLKLWGYPEPLLRREYFQLEDIFNLGSEPSNDSLFKKIHSEILEYVKKNKDLSYFFPLGLGNHIDHRILSIIGSDLSKKSDSKFYFYEDQPYAGEYSIDEIEEFVKNLNLNFKSRLLPFDNILEKMAILKLYKSQFDAEDIGFTFWHTQRRGGEIIWSDPENLIHLGGSKNE